MGFSKNSQRPLKGEFEQKISSGSINWNTRIIMWILQQSSFHSFTQCAPTTSFIISHKSISLFSSFEKAIHHSKVQFYNLKISHLDSDIQLLVTYRILIEIINAKHIETYLGSYSRKKCLTPRTVLFWLLHVLATRIMMSFLQHHITSLCSNRFIATLSLCRIINSNWRYEILNCWRSKLCQLSTLLNSIDNKTKGF